MFGELSAEMLYHGTFNIGSFTMSYQIENASVSTIAIDCVKGFRKVSVHVGAKYDAGFMGASSLNVWVPEDVTDINEIKLEAMRLAKTLAANISTTDLLPSSTGIAEKPPVFEEALEPEYSNLP